jgi:oligoendopeptidase F
MKETWDVSHIYPTVEAFNADLERFQKELTPAIASYEGKFKEDESFKAFLLLNREANVTLQKLYMYAECLSDLDKKDVARSERISKVELAMQLYSQAAAYSDPEILALGEEHVKAFLAKNPDLGEFSLVLDQLFLQKKHVLGAEQEKLLSNYSPLLGEGSTLYSQLSVADYVPKKAKLSDGSEIEVNQSNWTSLIANAKNAADRQAIFESLYTYYDEHKNIYGEIYNNVLQAELAEMRSRGYQSILEEHLAGKKIPNEVFLSLVKVASTHAEPLHKYLQIRAKYLGLPAHRSYDRFIQLAKSEHKYTYEEARNIFWASLANFPADFQSKAHEVLKEGYVDVFPHLGKRSGAYSNGTFNIHPYILLNFQGELDDCFTLAHESGHSIHTLYSEENQPLMKQDYTIFVAEIASTFNEHNLLDYLLNSGKLSKNDQIYLLQKAIDEIVATFYRQTLFGHYEYEIAKLAEAHQPINYQVLSDKMVELYKIYYGIDITEEKVKPLVWAYIPHLFYTPFYVYQYATSFTASMLLYDKVKAKEPGAFERYVGLLKSGSSDYPIAEVKAAGVDLTKEEAFLSVTKRMSELVDRLEVLLKK